ncbi:hypothetical protein [Consotaella aegiceratis]|uniref:hypothetical protein n=1 Tax=Consotaella aegiceratis TaxID=3097961 RepID=UPI002F4240BF
MGQFEAREYSSSSGAILPPPQLKLQESSVDPDEYINAQLSEEQKEQLINSAETFSNILRLSATSVFGLETETYQAEENVEHYRFGNGADRTYSESDIARMERDIPNFPGGRSGELAEFIESIRGQLTSEGGSPRFFHLWNNSQNNAWSSVDSNKTPWFYAVGLFNFSYSARVRVSGLTAIIEYKTYIFDRYDWNPGQGIEVPKGSIVPPHLGVDQADYLVPGTIDPLKKFALPGESRAYISQSTRNPDRYFVADEVMCALEAAGEAKRFNIVGASAIKTIKVYF